MSRFRTEAATSLRWVLALATSLSPLAATAQKTNAKAQAQPSKSSAIRSQSTPAAATAPRAGHPLLTPQTVALVRFKPTRLWRSSFAELLPTEVVTAAGLQYVGIDPLTITRIDAAIEPPYGPRLNYAVSVTFAEPVSLASLSDRVVAELTPVPDWPGRTVYAVDLEDPNAPLIAELSERTLIAASRPRLRSLLDDARSPVAGPFVDWLRSTGRDVDLHVGVNFETLRPLANMAIAAGLPQARESLDPPTYELLERMAPAVNEVRFIEAWADVSTDPGLEIAVEAPDAASADRLAECFDALRDANLANVRRVAERLDRSDPTQSAMADYLDRIGPIYVESVTPERDGQRFSRAFPGDDPADRMSLAMGQTAIAGVLIALLLPAVQAAREAARRIESVNNVKQIMLAMHNYHTVNGAFPPWAIYSDAGKPLLSWRVAMLPYLDEAGLYERFALDEPWDSPTNRALIAEMPEVFLDPSSQLKPTEGKTHYLGLVGERAFFKRDSRARSFREFTDGTSKSLAVVQVDDADAVPWTKPADYDVAANAADPIAGIGALHPGVFIVGFADGYARPISLDVDPDTLRALMTVNGKEPIVLP